MDKKNKRAQEEIVGFIIIVVIVAIIFLFFLNFYLRSEKTESIKSYEVNSFIQSFLQYTTECRDYLEYLPIQDLIFECNNDAVCLDEQEACEVLDSTLKNIARESWPVGEERPIKGYELNITVNQIGLVLLRDGNITGNYKGAKQSLPPKAGASVEIFFRAYY